MRVDTKQASSRVNENSLKPSHKAWVSALQWSPTQPHVVATTSHDGTVKMWDIRSSLPLHSARAQDKGSSQKGLSLAFAENGHALYTGGSDCRVKKFSC
jgi:ribosome biogenesis protein YTM1